MNLHEIYTTLRRRGMPEHPRLEHRLFTDSKGALTGGSGWLLANDGPRFWQSRIHNDDAQDILTMHALRWVGSMNHCILNHETDAIYKLFVDDRDKLRGKDTLLSEILAATEHLEPKTHDDEGYPLDQGDTGMRNPIY